MLHSLTYMMSRLRADRRGVTALEYGLIAALIAVVIISALTSVGKGSEFDLPQHRH